MVIKATYDPKFDANNYIRAIFDKAHLEHGRKNMQDDLINSIESEKIKTAITKSTDRDKTLKDIENILAENYQADTEYFKNRVDKLNLFLSKLGAQIKVQLVFLYQKPFPFKKISVYLTTMPLCPYNYKEKYIYVYAKTNPQNQARILVHELNHFMFYYYYSDLAPKLGKEKFELLKESLSIYTNPEQEGKPNEKPLRELFIKKQPKTLEQAIKIGVEYLLQTK